MTDTTTPADAAYEIRQGFEQTKTAIAADQQLTAQGKAEQIAKAADAANTAIEKIQVAAEAAAVAEKAVLEKRLLGMPSPRLGATPADNLSQQASFRDAMGRARMTTTPAELVDLQRSAVLTGDSELARATMVVGLQRGDVEAVNGWIASNPQHETDVEKLWAMTHGGQASITDKFFGSLPYLKVH